MTDSSTVQEHVSLTKRLSQYPFTPDEQLVQFLVSAATAEADHG